MYRSSQFADCKGEQNCKGIIRCSHASAIDEQFTLLMYLLRNAV